MNYHFDYIIDVVNNDGQLIWKIPHQTLFNKIRDLWPLITDYYYNYRPFALGNIDDLYNNYRFITKNEFNSPLFTKLFKAIYQLHGGIYSLSSSLHYSSNVHILSGTLYIDYHTIYACTNKSEFVKIFCRGKDIFEDISLIKCGMSTTKRETGLFIQDDLQLL